MEKRKRQKKRSGEATHNIILRLSPALARRIGLNQSIVLLQLDYLIGISRHEREGKMWTYQSCADLHEGSFPFWSVVTISRALNDLLRMRLVVAKNLNRHRYDKTRWWRLTAKARKLLGVAPAAGARADGSFQNEKSKQAGRKKESVELKNATRQGGTTIPKNNGKTTTNSSTKRGVPPKRGASAKGDGSPRAVSKKSSPAVSMYMETYGRPLTEEQEELVRSEVSDLVMWAEALQFWKSNNYRAQSVGKIVSKYKELIKGDTNHAVNRRNTINKPAGAGGAKRGGGSGSASGGGGGYDPWALQESV